MGVLLTSLVGWLEAIKEIGIQAAVCALKNNCHLFFVRLVSVPDTMSFNSIGLLNSAAAAKQTSKVCLIFDFSVGIT